MKNIYFSQVNYIFDDNAYLPYSSGVIACAAFSKPEIACEYCNKEMLYRREPIQDVVNRLDHPFLFAFSCYVWNMEYHKELARAVKLAYPDCLIVFGGHHVPSYKTSLLETEAYLDILMFGEGEIDFPALLCHLDALDLVNNIAYRGDGAIVMTERKAYTETSFPSPYLEGTFDEIMKDKYNFTATLETNRGCPFTCAYCDWGGESKTRLRQFPLERVFKEIEWFSEHKIDFVMGADSNFGILKRDMQIIDKLIEAKNACGFPNKFRVAYTKNSNETIFDMTKKLNDHGMCKGATLSFQSLSPTVLQNINRGNMPLEQFTELLQLYLQDNIPTYSEIILGLPGETRESFVQGLDRLLESQQHSSINIYYCELLPNSLLGQDDEIEKYGIETCKIPLNQYHCEAMTTDTTEYSTMICGTKSMPHEDWLFCGVYSTLLQTFHCLGLLQKIAVYVCAESNIRYSDFYGRLLGFIQGSSDESVLARVYNKIYAILSGVVHGSSMEYRTKNGGNLIWPLEEGAYIDSIASLDAVYAELRPFLQGFIADDALLDELIGYQRFTLNTPNKSVGTMRFAYDFYDYFKGRYTNKPAPLKRRANTITKEVGFTCATIEEYAKIVVWYGRKGGTTQWINEIANDDALSILYDAT
jgi:putative methyltransferase